MTEFTPVLSTIGGLLIGASAVMMLALNGRITGISGIVGGLLNGKASDRSWRVAFIVGLVVGGFAMSNLLPSAFGASAASLPVLAIAGLLVGFGTCMGSGCTSGHGVCGLSRVSRRSLVATPLFMAAGGVTVFVMRHVLGGATL